MLATFVFLGASAVAVPPAPLAIEEHNAGQGAVLFNAFIDPKGKAMNCRVEAIVGDDFSSTVCDRVMKTHFQPALGADGKPAFGVIREMANFWKADAKTPQYPVKLRSELAVLVKPVAGFLTEARDVPVAAVIDGEGRIADCAAMGAGTPARLAKLACAQLKAQWFDIPLEYPEGTPRSYVRKLTVSFEPDGAKP
jgi:hypothetical protein